MEGFIQQRVQASEEQDITQPPPLAGAGIQATHTREETRFQQVLNDSFPDQTQHGALARAQPSNSRSGEAQALPEPQRGRGPTIQHKQQKALSKRKVSAPARKKQPRKRQRSLATAMESTTPSGASGAIGSSAMVGQTTSEAVVTPPAVTETSNTRDSASPTAAALPQLFVEKLVAYSPAKESWLSGRIFEDAGSAYIVGRVSRFDKKKALFQIHWVDTQFQKADKWISMSVVQRGMENYKNVMASPSKPAWKSLCQPDSTESGIVEDDSDLEEVEESFERYDPEVILPSSLPEVESITNMKFDPVAQINGPTDLYQHPDGNAKTRVRPHFRHLFEHSASSSFFAYIPVYYWVEVLHQTNKAMRAHELEKKLSTNKPFTLQELMTFLGILFFMKLVDKGEYANYWGRQIEDCIVGGNHTGLDKVMPLSRFKLLRQHFCFRHVPKAARAASADSGSSTAVASGGDTAGTRADPDVVDIDELLSEDTTTTTSTSTQPAECSSVPTSASNSQQASRQSQNTATAPVPPQPVDPVRRIRPLLNMLKITGGKYIEIGRNVSLDEASIASKTKYGRRLIMFNPMKPGGKYHFRIYTLCCANTWIAINFRVHCASDLSDRMQGVVSKETIAELRQELDELSTVRSQVMEVVRPLYHTNRVINADNYYMSVQLLAALRVKGLYGRGTIRGNSLHFPHHVVLKKKECRRGQYRQAVSVAHEMVAVAWYDSAVVKMVSNADKSSEMALTRRVGSQLQPFPAPLCVSEYNTNVQGVDRLDQLRERFSLADGHTFKKWYKKLGMAFVDIARVNAYMTRKLTIDVTRDRDPHRSFVAELAEELISGKWMEAPSDRRMFYSARGESGVATAMEASAMWHCGGVEPSTMSSPQKSCVALNSKQIFGDKKRGRHCVVCRWEDRFPTVVTDHCTLHGVSLCQIVHTTAAKPYFCQQPTWTCWEKYHKFYLRENLFSAKGNLRKTSNLFTQRRRTEAGPTRSVQDEQSVNV